MIDSIVPCASVDLNLSESQSESQNARPILRAVICNSCGLLLTMFPVSPLAASVGPLAPIRIKKVGCLCSLPPSWLQSLVEDAQRGIVREYGWQGKLLAALAVAGVRGALAHPIARNAVPLRPELVTWAKRRMGTGRR